MLRCLNGVLWRCDLSQNIVKHVSAALNGKQKKIPYDTTVRWFEENAPAGVVCRSLLSVRLGSALIFVYARDRRTSTIF
jgi:hypothetical protein